MWIIPKDYLSYYEWVPSRTERLIQFARSFFSRLRWRGVIVATMFFVSFLQLGALPVKVGLVSLAAYALMNMPLGARRIEQLGLRACFKSLLSRCPGRAAARSDAAQTRDRCKNLAKTPAQPRTVSHCAASGERPGSARWLSKQALIAFVVAAISWLEIVNIELLGRPCAPVATTLH